MCNFDVEQKSPRNTRTWWKNKMKRAVSMTRAGHDANEGCLNTARKFFLAVLINVMASNRCMLLIEWHSSHIRKIKSSKRSIITRRKCFRWKPQKFLIERDSHFTQIRFSIYSTQRWNKDVCRKNINNRNLDCRRITFRSSGNRSGL